MQLKPNNDDQRIDSLTPVPADLEMVVEWQRALPQHDVVAREGVHSR